MPGPGGCALVPAGAHPHFSPPQPPLGRTPSEPVSAAPGPAKPGLPRERGAGRQEGCKSRSEPAVTMPPALAQGAGRTGLRSRRPLQMRRQLLQLWLGRAAVAAPSWEPGAEEPRLGRRAATRRTQLPGSLAGTPGRRGVRGEGEGESEAHRRCARLPPRLRRPTAPLPSRPPRSARISGRCRARASDLRAGRARATEHAQCRPASPAQGAAPATFHFSGLWRRLREEKPGGWPGGGPGGAGRGRGRGPGRRGRAALLARPLQADAAAGPRGRTVLAASGRTARRRRGLGCGDPEAGRRGAAGYLPHVAWRLSALKGSWVTLSPASLSSYMSALP